MVDKIVLIPLNTGTIKHKTNQSTTAQVDRVGEGNLCVRTIGED